MGLVERVLQLLQLEIGESRPIPPLFAFQRTVTGAAGCLLLLLLMLLRCRDKSRQIVGRGRWRVVAIAIGRA